MKRISFAQTGLLFVLFAATTPAGASTERVSVAFDGTQANGDNASATISADGRFVSFTSRASNLIEGDTNDVYDIFAFDRQSRQTTRVSVSSDGAQANGHSTRSMISADGRFVAFHSVASNLVEADTNGVGDVFMHDRQTGQTSRVSVTSNGTQANGESVITGISADGRFVAFSSWALNLVEADTNGVGDAFVHDRQTGQTTRVSIASDGTQANGENLFDPLPVISADGRFVAFQGEASNLVEGDTNGFDDVFVHDRQTGQTTRVSIASDGTQANGDSEAPAISIDGRFIAFSSWASNLVEGDTNGEKDAFMHDRQTGQTTRVSIASDGTQPNGASGAVSLSDDCRFVTFYSLASNLVEVDTNNTYDAFVRDRLRGRTICVSVTSNGTQANGESHLPTISGNGRFVAFSSFASNLVDDDTGQIRDVFVASFGEPRAVADSYVAVQNVQLSIQAPGVLVNDFDPEGDPLTVALVLGPVHGTLALSVDGSFTYLASPGFAGADSFTYKVNDGFYDSNVATATITTEIPAAIAVKAPNGGQVWKRGTIRPITWASTVGTGTVTIQLYIAGTMLKGDIVTNAPNTGYYSWKIPTSLPSLGRYRIKIIWNSDQSVFDESNKNFGLN
jgi:hypothetical protein